MNARNIFSAFDYATLSDIVFQEDYPGYRSNVIESPHGDGKLDDKKFAHVAEKYLANYKPTNEFNVQFLKRLLHETHDESIKIAVHMGIPKKFWPVKEFGAIRILEYSPEAITNPHTDFDLFTLMCYRNNESYFKYVDLDLESPTEHVTSLQKARCMNNQIHFGEILEEIDPQLYKATPHEVIASNAETQYSIVYFAIPAHSAILPSGVTVGDWINERISRSRYTIVSDTKS